MKHASHTPTLERLQAAHRKVAALVMLDHIYIPIFERLEHEIKILENQGDAISRARAIAANHRAVA